MSVATTALRVRRASDEFARAAAQRIVRGLLLGLGGALVVGGILIAPLPGPGGLPMVVLGLMIVLHNSFRAKREFVKFSRAHPKLMFPIRRLLRRNPQVVMILWQQYLKVERLLLPRPLRFAVRVRRSVRRRYSFRT